MPTSTRKYKYALGPVAARLKFRTDRSGECWLWTGRLNHGGYAEMKLNGRYQMAHRVAYEEFVGPIPEGLQIDHRCHDPRSCSRGVACEHRRCVNPAHLEAVTGRENALRSGGFAGVNAAKTHCLRGHAFNTANTYINPDGARVCRICKRDRNRRSKASRRLA